jgi:formylglycine-generating enzyme
MRWLCIAMLLLGQAAPASAFVSMYWRVVGSPGNSCDPQSDGCYGSVAYAYSIGKFEVTNAQYAEFLNAKASSDPLQLWSILMGQEYSRWGGIARHGFDGSYTYSAIPGRENLPVDALTFYNALRFVNWLNNGQGTGDTETGSYTLLGGTAIPSNATALTRSAAARFVVPTENEWYKAAYYNNALPPAYFDYPANSDPQPVCAPPTAAPNTANCGDFVDDLTPVGAYTNSASPSGTFDQGGNVNEWNETPFVDGTYHGLRGGAFIDAPAFMSAASRNYYHDQFDNVNVGVRLAYLAPLPEPGTSAQLTVGALGAFALFRMTRRRKRR